MAAGYRARRTKTASGLPEALRDGSRVAEAPLSARQNLSLAVSGRSDLSLTGMQLDREQDPGRGRRTNLIRTIPHYLTRSERRKCAFNTEDAALPRQRRNNPHKH